MLNKKNVFESFVLQLITLESATKQIILFLYKKLLEILFRQTTNLFIYLYKTPKT